MKQELEKADIVSVLKSHNIKPSLQRIWIFDYLVDHRIHPTVDEIYKELAPSIPTLSKTTVYNTLNLFKEQGLLKEIFIEDNEVRYDINTDFHGHFKCMGCGKIYDFDICDLKTEIDNNSEFKITDQDIYYRGYCKECS